MNRARTIVPDFSTVFLIQGSPFKRHFIVLQCLGLSISYTHMLICRHGEITS